MACFVLLVIAAMIAFVWSEAWPALSANGLGFLSGGNPDKQLAGMLLTGQHPPPSAYEISIWPFIWATILTSVVAVGFGLLFSLFASIFIVEFAPPRLRGIVIPAVRLLAAVPSVVYGLIGILVLVPFINEHLISLDRKRSVQYAVQLDGSGVLVACLILTIMVVPIMIAIIVDALRSIPSSWTEGSIALGANRWETMWSVSVRAARPAIVAAAVLAGARALGEAIMISMVSGSRGFTPLPQDGLTFLFEPLRTLAATMVENIDGLNAPAVRSNIYLFALLLLFSSLVLSVGGYLAKLPMRRQGLRI